MKSRCASQVLAWELRLGGDQLGESVDAASMPGLDAGGVLGAIGAVLALAESVDTCMAGFGADGVLGTTGAVLALAESVDTCMAGFAGHGLPCQPAVRTGTPAWTR